MGKKEKIIDNYIARSADFAKPILKHLRDLVHQACPEAEEKIKWSFPHFDYKNEMLCSMAAFKQHCAFGFWKGTLMKEIGELGNAKNKEAMGNLGRIQSLRDLPSDKKMIGYIKEAMKLNDLGIKLPSRTVSTAKKEVVVPDYFMKELKKNKKALNVFENFSYSHRKEYVEWITDAKTEITRNRRIANALEWIAEGKSQNWKYIK